MRRGGWMLILVLLLYVAFYLGVTYERNDCRIDLPDTVSAVDDTLRCK
jgi:hypothetical protein